MCSTWDFEAIAGVLAHWLSIPTFLVLCLTTILVLVRSFVILGSMVAGGVFWLHPRPLSAEVTLLFEL